MSNEHGHEKPEVKEWKFVNGAWYDNWDEMPSGVITHLVSSATMPDWVPELSEITPTNSDKPVTKSESGDKERSDGSTASYYELPEGATELQHLISHRNLNAQLGEIFRACYRYGLVSHSDMLRDAKKIKFYAQAEIERLEKLASSSE